jgi:IMP dehydrogenase
MVARFTKKITEAPYAFTFDDLILLPGFSKVEPSEVSLASRATRNIHLNLPFVSSPMDTVTEEEMAIALARAGGVGQEERVLHNQGRGHDTA